jgi:hypothetical protein
MPAALKSRIVSTLLLVLLLALLTEARSADASLRKALAASSKESALIPRRIPRPLSREEIFQVIQSNLAQMGISGRGGLLPEDLKIQSSVAVLKDDLGLEVKGIGFDPIRRETVFELWTSREPQYLPFKVTTRRDPHSWGYTPPLGWNLGGGGGLSGTRNQANGQGVSPAPSKLPVLAKPGRPATLVMLGQNVRITTTVVPLQPGGKGQWILVRDLTTARVISAEVVDEGLLQTSF